mmetsp:Transcript_27108/g.82142  ORF Transcript_27108/g.82142 Transcript_27108/m.82142 type:complete len:91 (-) Transcript_27108:65-337(-)|eukprot:scaffold158120_cov41-Tisochrysis_lutea.AAC.7
MIQHGISYDVTAAVHGAQPLDAWRRPTPFARHVDASSTNSEIATVVRQRGPWRKPHRGLIHALDPCSSSSRFSVFGSSGATVQAPIASPR